MIRDITLGQYYQTDSVLHRLDCRVKLVGTLAFIISLFVVNNVWGYLLAAMFLALCIRLSNVPFKFMVKGMKSIVFLMLFAVVFNLFLTPGTPAVTIWKLKITWEGIEMASKMAVRLAMVPLLVPLFIAAFRRANDLAMAMEARCYRGGEGRTKMKPLVYRKQDYMGYGVLVAYLVAAVLIGRVLL